MDSMELGERIHEILVEVTYHEWQDEAFLWDRTNALLALVSQYENSPQKEEYPSVDEGTHSLVDSDTSDF